MRTKRMNRRLCFWNFASLTQSGQRTPDNTEVRGSFNFLHTLSRLAPNFAYRHGILALSLLLPATALAGPTGEQVITGSATITRPNTVTTQINQQTQKAIIDWQNFSIGQQEQVRFLQPGTSSITLNRVLGNDPSRIFGSLSANGQVFLVNPSGVLFAPTSQVNVHGLLATTHNISNDDFMAGRYLFAHKDDQLNGTEVINQGTLQAGENGYIVLAGDYAANAGVIQARLGQVALASGNRFTLDLDGDQLIGLAVDEASLARRAGVYNFGTLAADGGRILMTARVAGELAGAVVNNEGLVQARSIEERNGEIILQGGSTGIVTNSGTLEASGKDAGKTGGTVQMLGKKVALLNHGVVDVSGSNGGGTALIGGDYQGRNPAAQNAHATFLGKETTIKADAIENGDGGRVIVWAHDVTRTYGSISARGGEMGGDGGFVETSGGYLDAQVSPRINSPHGAGGTWLLDPYDIVIGSTDTPATYTGSPNFVGAGTGTTSYISASVIEGILDGGTSVIVDTTGTPSPDGTGNITVSDVINTTNAGAATLTLKAHNDIVVNSALNMNNSLVLTADQDTSGAGNVVINKSVTAAAITASGKDILFSSLDGGTTYGTLYGNSVSLSAANMITPSPYGYATEIVAPSLSLSAINGVGIGGKVLVAEVAGTIQFSNTNNGVNIYNTSTAPGRIFTGTNTNGAVRLESNDTANATTLGNLSSGGNLVVRMNNLTTGGAAAIGAGANTVYLSPYNNSPVPTISIDGAATFNLTGADISRISAAKIIIGNDSFGNYAPTANIATNAAVSITNSANLEIWGNTINTGANAFSNIGGQLALNGDAMSIGGTLDVGSGTVWLKGKTSTQNIDLGGNDFAGTLGLDTNELNTITTDILRIGSMTAGSLNVSAAIAPSGTSTLSLESGGDITQASAGTISETNLAIKALGNVALDTAANLTTNLAASLGDGSHQNNNFKFKNSPALNIGSTIDSTTGINIQMDGNNFDFTNPNSVISLISSGALSQSAGAVLGGKAVYAEGSKVTLTEANPTGIIAGKSTGASTGDDSFAYTSANPILLSQVSGTTGVSANPAGADQLAIKLVSTGGSINQETSASLSASGRGAHLDAQSGGVNLSATPSTLGFLSAKATAGGVFLDNSTALTITDLGAGVIGVIGGSGDVNITAPSITVAANSSGNNFFLSANQATTGTVDITGASAITATGIADILADGSFSIPATGTITANKIYLGPYTSNRPMLIGGSNGSAFSIPDATDLNEARLITTRLLLGDPITASPTGNITLAANISRPTTELLMGTGGTISQTGGTISAKTLGILADGNIDLPSTNSISEIAAQSVTGSIAVNNSTNIKTVSGTEGSTTISGLTTTNMNISLTAASDIILYDLITAGTGQVFLTSTAGAIVDVNGVGVNNVIAGTLDLSAYNNIDLDAQVSSVNATSSFGTVTVRPYPPPPPPPPPPPAPTIDQCTADPTLDGCTTVLPTLDACITDPTLPGCTVVLPTLDACILDPTAPGCTTVLPTLDACTTDPTLPGCTVVLPTLDACILDPTAPGCTT
ncbi:MAG: filamentous hemagglutinin N-terminal domain-containing protein, partial [Desulfobulbaceae bacterium]|nr:filamentous hemagglutinin N-terminal domain-containing protein [Desulfobulbaceae bacterium]HIJ90694.1 filamentous hemagglutinin N-terminal domain-containing protein [Deltaproteobacteria bacterium]